MTDTPAIPVVPVTRHIQVVEALQARLLSELDDGDERNWGRISRSGEVKDLAISLGVAIDKLAVLLEIVS